MRSFKITVMVVTSMLILPIIASANESCDRLVKDLEKADCERVDATVRTFLDQNAENVNRLQKLADADRKKEIQSYRKAMEKADAITTHCAQGRAREIDAKLTTVGADPIHISGFYTRVTATLEFMQQTNSTDPFVYEQLVKSFEDLRGAYARAGKLGKPVYN